MDPSKWSRNAQPACCLRSAILPNGQTQISTAWSQVEVQPFPGASVGLAELPLRYAGPLSLHNAPAPPNSDLLYTLPHGHARFPWSRLLVALALGAGT